MLGPAVLAQPAMARCSRLLRLMDVALGLELGWGWGYLSLEQVLGDWCGQRGMFGGYVARSGILRSRIPVDGSAVDALCACP